jgi:sterol desaturase/sphingolipid hydroxylase (fatty acid hydroxylase superfamily)
MGLIALAVPFFLLAIIIELFVDWRRRTGYYRSNDAINSISAGMLGTTLGYFTHILPLLGWGFVIQKLSFFEMPLAWFDTSIRGIGLWVVAAIAVDFFYYWFHRLSHEISILWASHAVHHQSEDYNLSTALRQTSTGFLFGWIFYVPLFIFGFPLVVILVVKAVNLIYQFWVHTQHIRHLGPLEAILMTPSHHRVHHGQNERYIDKNYGGILITWDRLFGTFEPENEDDPVIYGVRKPLANWNPFWANLQVYDYLLFDARKTRRWRDKIGIWFRHTGWRPEDVDAAFPKGHTDLSHFRKFDPKVGAGTRRYTIVQFGVAIAATLWIGQLFARGGASGVLIPCMFLWSLLLSLGMLNEARAYARSFEVLRLLVVVPSLLAVWHWSVGSVSATVVALFVLYVVVSVLGVVSISRTEESLISS